MPIILLWIPPIIGVLPLFLAVLTPRQVLSRQFFNTYEREEFGQVESEQRQVYTNKLAKLLLSSSLSILNDVQQSGIDGTNNNTNDNNNSNDNDHPDMESIERIAAALPTSLKDCSRQHIQALALSMGYCQRFPLPMARALTELSPTPLLRFDLEQTGSDLVRDDTMLLQESYHRYDCDGLTDDEVLEACLIRGMPVSNDYMAMRRHMTNHLKVMEELRERFNDKHVSKDDKEKASTMGLVTMHLPAIQAALQRDGDNGED